MIGDDVTVTILGVEGVRIGISAPDDVGVHREEIYQKIHLETMPFDSSCPLK